MKSINRAYWVLTAAILLALLSCERKTPVNDPVIEAVKQDTKSNRWSQESNKEFIGFLAGTNGHVEWSSFKPAEDKLGPDVFVVEVTIDKRDLGGSPHELRIQILYNTSAEVAQWGYVEIDGVQQTSLIEWVTFFLAVGTEVEKI